MEAAVQQTYTKLLASLEDLTKSYRHLLELVRKEKEYLIAAEREKLEENNQLKEAAIFKLRAQDSLRARHAVELATLVKADAEIPRLLDIATHIGGPEGDRLRSMHAALDILIKRITDLNKENEAYAQSALRSLGGAMNDIKETLTGNNKTYARQGQVKMGPDTAGHFVSKEA